MSDWEAVIGLEVHVELSTRTKMFSACPNEFGGAPNTRVTEVDLGLPGTLPVVNGTAVEHAIRMGLALDCEIAPVSQFHRKNYFYPDMPKNYQISQYDVPICGVGHLDIETSEGPVRIGVTRIHMEEDAGKNVHVGESGRVHGADYSLVDYNRAGVPLLECVSEPDIRTAEQAQAYLTELRGIVLALGISDAKLEEGSMRCDANVSIHKPGTPYGTRAEIKNMNSVRSLGRAIEYEIARQIDVVESGGTVVQETRHWDEDAGLIPLLDAAVAGGADAADATKWLVNEVAGWQNETGRSAVEALPGEEFASLLGRVADGTLGKGGARKVLTSVLAGEGTVAVLAKDHEQVSDVSAIEAIVDQVIAEQADAAQKVRDGNPKAMGALVGGVMRASKGKADPALVNQLLNAKLQG